MIMQHTIAAVYNSQSQAQKACDALISSGFSRDEVHISQSEESGQNLTEQSGSESSGSGSGGIRSFFAELFGARNSPDTDLYSQAVMQGNYVLTVNVPEDDKVEEAAEVMDQFDPLDIDEQSSQWKSGGWASQDSMRSSESTDTAQTGMTGRQTGMTGATITGETQQLPSMSTAEPTSAVAPQSTSETQAIPVVQEELKVGKRAVQRGGVRVYQRVTERPVQESINLQEERVSVERRPVDQPADVSAFKEGSIEVRETAEEPVVEKVARVVEEVVIGKEVTQREEQISDTVRSTDVEIEQLPGSSSASASQSTSTGSSNLAGSAAAMPSRSEGMRSMGSSDDELYRTHWNSNYANSGGAYEDYAPAYQYGSSLSGSDRYQGQRWDDVEPNVRQDWETKNPGSTWEKMKDAVRHGWESMTNKVQ
jgi:uncharacterized protein (TIGR02271 family)